MCGPIPSVDQPERVPKRCALPAESAPPEIRRPVRVVIADDHRIVRAGLVALLANTAEIEIVGQASDGLEAIELVETLDPDVVVMDVTMPRMNGIEATRRLHRLHPNVRVIGLSMHDSREIFDAMLQAGASRFLTKGGPPHCVIDAILDRRARE
jgi:DNA-binding NarL/FixJ family response regulator